MPEHEENGMLAPRCDLEFQKGAISIAPGGITIGKKGI